MLEQRIKIKSYFDKETKSKLTNWEKEFIDSLYNSKKCWSVKQKEILDNIIKKYFIEQKVVVNKITYLPTGYAKGAVINQKITSKIYRKNRFINKKTNN